MGTPIDALMLAIDRAGGTPTALAESIGRGVKRQNVEHWIRLGRAPARQCPSIERATRVRCERLRPDVEWSVLRKPGR